MSTSSKSGTTVVRDTASDAVTDTVTDADVTDKIVIHEALAVIDKALTDMLQRELVSTGEVADLLLDVRSLLTTSPAAAK
jgi:hypothetical protein